MWPRSQAVRAFGVLGAAALACASGSSGEKGRLVPLDLPREKLAEAHAPKRLALVIGISQFEDPGWRPLRFPDADAAAVADVLRDTERGARQIRATCPSSSADTRGRGRAGPWPR